MNLRVLVVGCGSILVVALLALVSLPLSLLLAGRPDVPEHTDISQSTLLRGKLWVQLWPLPGLARVSYRWCPGLSPLAWCVDASSGSAHASGRFGVTGLNSLRVSSAEVSGLEFKHLGLGAGIVDARLGGSVDQVEIQLGDCATGAVTRLEAQLASSDVQIFGHSTGAHRVTLTTDSAGISGTLEGSAIGGSMEYRPDTMEYSVSGTLDVSDEVADLVGSMLEPLGDNRFAWNLSGRAHCRGVSES